MYVLPPFITRRLSHDPALQAPSFVHTFVGMSSEEKEERSCRAYAFLKKYLYSLETDPEAIKSDINTTYCEKSLKSRVLKFYQACHLIRKNFSEWEKYISDPTNGVSSPLRSVVEDSELVFGLALLDRFKIIHLNPSEPFVSGKKKSSKIYIDADVTVESFKEMLPLWERLGRPDLLEGDLMNRISDADFSLSETVHREIQVPDLGLVLFDYTYENKLYERVNEVLRWIFFTPIMHHKGTVFKLGIADLLSIASFAMAFEGDDTDILECIRVLFPNEPDYVPWIISEYHRESCSLTRCRDQSLETTRQAVHQEAFGCGVVLGENRDKTLIHHRGALLQIENHPELFEKWKDPYKVEYTRYVVPALLKKLGVVPML